MSALVVDWLGRGGIAQTAEVWRDVGREHGVDIQLLSRSGREVVPDIGFSSPIPGRIFQHLSGVVRAVRTIRSSRPETVVLHSWLIPALEMPVIHASKSVGAKIILVAHNHQSHTKESGLDFGLSRLFDGADVVVVHSEYVRNALPQSVRKKCVVAPLPKPLALLQSRPSSDESATSDLSCLQFGVARSTKNTSLISELAESDLRGWTFVQAGTIATEGASHASVVTKAGFQSPSQLVELVQNATAVLLPYTSATQSAAVILARCLGAVPIASAVGGIPSQIDDGVDGLLIESGSGTQTWADALKRVADHEWRTSAVATGLDRMRLEHEEFVSIMLGLIGADEVGTRAEHLTRLAD